MAKNLRFFHNKRIERPVSNIGINTFLPKKAEKDSPLHRAKVNQLQFALPKAIIQRELDANGLKRETEIWIYPEYPYGFTAIVGISQMVYIYLVDDGVGRLIDVVPCLGVRPNGSLIY